MALLASDSLVELAKLRGIEFDHLWWLALDCMAIGCFIRRGMPCNEWAILGLLLVASAAYLTTGPAFYWTTIPQFPRNSRDPNSEDTLH